MVRSKASPKSHRRSSPSAVRSRFSGFMSRCRMPCHAKQSIREASTPELSCAHTCASAAPLHGQGEQPVPIYGELSQTIILDLRHTLGM